MFNDMKSQRRAGTGALRAAPTHLLSSLEGSPPRKNQYRFGQVFDQTERQLTGGYDFA